MKVAGLMVVRDEADIIGCNLAHHLGLGIDEFWIIDNGSSDGTVAALRRVARRHPEVRWRIDAGPFDQSSLTSELARDAVRAGADWVMAIDADEFWVTNGPTLPEQLDAAPRRVAALSADVVNYVQARWVRRPSRRALLTVTRRAPTPMGGSRDAEWLVENRHAAYVETAYPPKLVCRAVDGMRIVPGNHGVEGVEGIVEPTAAITCLHAPLRARDRIDAKAEHADRMPIAAFPDGDAWQTRRWRALPPSALDPEWRANSYEDLDLDVFGFTHRLVVDTRLRDTVRPHTSWTDRARASFEFRYRSRRRRAQPR